MKALNARQFASGLLLAALTLLGACSSEQSELRAWMDDVKRNTQPIRDQIPEPKKFEPYRYDNVSQVDPFSNAKLQAALDRLNKRPTAGPRPDDNRRREALENFPLETIRMVGHLADNKQAFALLQAESVVYQARAGNYAGQNHGRIVKVTESEVTLKELVQDAAGDWVERESSLRLQESKK